ncbi:MAG TPA: hypothetical protein VGH63_01785 [Polyangia bacterium]
MKKLLLAVTLCTFGTAYAQTTAKPAPSGAKTAPSGGTAAGAPPMMEMPKPGPDQDALKPFVHNGSYTGTHMMDGKEMPEKGKQTCKWLPGNMWAACDIDMTTGTGKTAMKWMGHLVFGYDTMAKGYRAVMTDNMGMMGRMKGTLDGKKMVWESMDEMKVPNMPSKERVTDDATDPKSEKMTFEGMMGGKWMPMGTGSFKNAGGK